MQIAEGLYLGQLLLATRRLLRDYDPRRGLQDCRYEHLGYLALWDQRWNPEARLLFPFLKIPVTDPLGGETGTSAGSHGVPAAWGTIRSKLSAKGTETMYQKVPFRCIKYTVSIIEISVWQVYR